jgi:signal transduction histidine kinase
MDEEDAQLVDSAIIECDRMKNLIKGLHDFNRPSTGKMAPMNIHSAIDSILMLSKKEYQTKKITVETNYADLPQVKAVADQIKQVLLNLLNNAIYACSKGDTITISTDFINKEGIRIKIQDNGKGIKPEHLNKIFDPFFTTKPAIKGTGLGLSISYGIIKKHGGRIDVKSEPDKGTIFTITLPTTL